MKTFGDWLYEKRKIVSIILLLSNVMVLVVAVAWEEKWMVL